MQDPQGMVRSLVTQLSLHCIKTSTGMNTHYISCADGKQQPSPTMWLDILRLLALEVSNKHLIFGAPDECGNRPGLLELIDTIVQWKLPNLHFLLASRLDLDIEITLLSLPRDE